MPENKLLRWYWIMEEKSREPILRGGQLDNLEHNQFFLEDIESPDVKAEVVETFNKHPKFPPTIEYKEVRLGKNREKVVVTGIRSGRE